MPEIWKNLARFPGYSFSSLGNIRRDGPARGAVVGKLLQPTFYGSGYHKVFLYNKGNSTGIKVHRLILEAFEGRSNLEINHKNGIKTDNRYANLEYVTRSQNELHAYRVGLKGKRKLAALVEKVSEEGRRGNI